MSRVTAARQLALAAATGEVLDAMADAGIRTVMLKGTAIAARLYEDPSTRAAGDVDLLVEPRHFRAAEQILVRLGFHDPLSAARETEQHTHAVTFRRQGGMPACVDLHTAIYWCSSDPELTWDEFSRDTTLIRIADRSVETLSDAAQAFVIAAHAVQHAELDKLREDLRRALAAYDRRTWEKSAAIAGRLGAEAVLAAGLGLVEGGARLADELGLKQNDASAELRLRRAGVPPGSLALIQLGETRSARRRLTFALGKLFPSRALMREAYPFAGRGRATLALSYLYRPLWLAVRLPRALGAWRRATR